MTNSVLAPNVVRQRRQLQRPSTGKDFIPTRCRPHVAPEVPDNAELCAFLPLTAYAPARGDVTAMLSRLVAVMVVVEAENASL